MSTFPRSEQLLRRIRTRLTIRAIAGRAFWTTLILAALYAVLLLTGRLTGLFPNYFTPWSVVIVPGLALLVAMLIPARPDFSEAARAVDRRQGTKDLFLTLTTLERSASEYKPLVGRDAEKAAQAVKPELVVPYHWEHRALVAAATMGVLLLGAFFVPTLDPFGKVAVAKQQEDAHKLLEATRQATEARKAQLASKDTAKENSDETEQATEKLKAGMRKLTKGEPKKNLELLNAHQKEIGEMYRKLNSGELKSLFDKLAGDQKLGQLHDEDLFRKWQKELQQGNSESLKQDLGELQKSLERLANATDPVEKTELQREIQKKLNELSDFANKKTGSQALNAALQRAMKQLETAKQEGLTQESMEALQESMEVAKKEMELLAQSSRDLKQLEKALEVISMAKQMTPKDGIEGEMFNQEMSLADYAEFYKQLMAGRVDEEGDGLGGEGRGKGDVAPEDDSRDSKFIDEKSKSAVQKGKILLSISEKGLSEAGDIKQQEYKRVVGEIKQSLDEVITKEEIPPGYVESIKKYFDALEEKQPK